MFRNIHLLGNRTGGRPSARRRLAVAGLLLFTTAALPAAAAAQDEPSVAVRQSGGIYTVAASFIVRESPSFALAALTDYGAIPRFMPEVRTSQVLERSDRRAVVEQEAVARFMMFSRRVHLVLEVQETGGTIRFRDRCGRSFALYEGVWAIAEQAGISSITYELTAKPRFDVPEFLLRRLLKRDASQMIEHLKAEIHARARAQSN